MNSYSKALLMVVVTVLSGIVASLTGDNFVSAFEWINVALAGVGAISVAIVPNLNAGIGKYAKGIVAAATAVLTLLINLIADGVTVSEWLQLVIAAAGALGVLALPGPQHPANPAIQGA